MENKDINVDVEENKPNYLEDLQRLQAEFENFTKRSELEKQDLLKNSNEKLIFKLLSVLDSLELALKHNSDEGTKLIYSELSSLLEHEGLSKIKAEGKFDPTLHEVLMQEEGDVEDEIIEELQSGYMLGEKVIRATKVNIAKGKNE